MRALFDGWKKCLLFPAAFLLAVGLGTGCGGDDDNGTGPDNGGGVNEQIAFTFDGTQYTGDLCMANYMVGDDATSLTTGDGDSWALLIDFPGSSTGSFNAADGVYAMLTLAPHLYQSEEFVIAVTAYGGIGAAVTGTFSGTLVHIADENDVKQITNGTFTAERLSNVQ